jgi:hypothetical protein
MSEDVFTIFANWIPSSAVGKNVGLVIDRESFFEKAIWVT